MSEDFMENLFNNEFTIKEYNKIIDHCKEQLKRIINVPLSKEEYDPLFEVSL